MKDSESSEVFAGDQLRHEIWNCIRRSGMESDVTAYQALGVLEIIKADIIESLEKLKREEHP